MNFLIRGVQPEDLQSLYDLARQFGLLNLPADKRVLEEKIERSVASFSGKSKKEDAEYLFVVFDRESQTIAGSSLILAKHGTKKSPHHSFKILKRDRFSKDLGIGFIHQVLRLSAITDGPTEIGGLLVDKSFRRRPEKLGRQISLTRFVYMAMRSERFEKRVLCELTPPLTEEGRSEFWEALGRRFTGLPYQEADLISQKHKEFISSLFPEEDIYMTLLSSKARLVLGQVGDETRAAQHLLEKIGFQYLQEVDPFDGGPHYGAEMKEISVVKATKSLVVGEPTAKTEFSTVGLIGLERENQFYGAQTAFDVSGDKLLLPQSTLRLLELNKGDMVYLSPIP
jgi:arginine N-succinyltransferase